VADAGQLGHRLRVLDRVAVVAQHPERLVEQLLGLDQPAPDRRGAGEGDVGDPGQGVVGDALRLGDVHRVPRQRHRPDVVAVIAREQRQQRERVDDHERLPVRRRLVGRDLLQHGPCLGGLPDRYRLRPSVAAPIQ
jgi:hypothetical protein